MTSPASQCPTSHLRSTALSDPMVNAPSWDSARRAIWQHSPRWNELMPAIAQKHSAVKEFLCSGIGARLMCIDAKIMCRNLTDLNREGITALPIHDSVIVQA